MKNSKFNLFHENRLVFMAEGARKAPEKSDVPSVKEADSQRDLGTEAARTEEKISHILKSLDGLKKPTAKTEKMKEQAIKIREKLNGLNEKREELTLQTLDKLNSTFDNNIQGFRIQVLKDVLSSSVQDIDRGNVDSLITAFALLKSDDSPLSIPNSGYSIQRRGHLLVLEHKGGWKNSTGEKMPKEEITFKVALVGDKWEIQGSEGKKLPEKFTPTQNPLTGAVEQKLESYKFYSSGQTKLNYEPKQKPASPSTPEAKVAKPKENVEKYDAVKVAECLKLIHEHTGAKREIPGELFKALQDFIKDIAKDSTKAFNQGDVNAYITRSKDGRSYRIATEMKGGPVVQYLEKGGSAIGNAVGKKAEYKLDPISNKIPSEDLKNGRISVKFEGSQPAPSTKPKTVDTNEPTPDPKLLRILKNQEGKVHEEARIAEGMKEWTKNLKKAVDQIVKSFEWLSKVKDLAKEIQQAKGCDWNQASKDAVRFKDWCENFDRSINLKTQTPQETITAINQGLNMLPGEVQTRYATKFKIEDGKSRLASLGKEVPSSAEVARGEVAPKPQKESGEVKGIKEAYDSMAKSFDLGKIDISNWPGTGKSVSELKLVLGIQDGNSHVMKDGKGNEFYFKVNGNTMELYIKNKGTKEFIKYALNENNGKRVVPTSEVGVAEKGGREKYDEKMEANFQLLLSKVKNLKKGEDISFKTKDGREFFINSLGKNRFQAIEMDINNNTLGEAKLSLKELANFRNMAQRIADKPNFKSANESNFAKIDKINLLKINDIQLMLAVKNLREIMQSPADKERLRTNFQDISEAHAEMSLAHTYSVSEDCSLTVSEKGIIKLTQKGIPTITYTPKKSNSAVA